MGIKTFFKVFLLAISLCLVVSPCFPLMAAEIVVDTLDEDDLKNAVYGAAPGDTVRVTAEGVITLSEEISLPGNVKIVGPGQGKLSISGNNAYRVFNVGPAAVVEISELSIVNGFDLLDGGGIVNQSSQLKVNNCTFRGNVSGVHGGGIHNYECNPIISNCAFIGNDSTYGDGMSNERSNPVVTNCTFSGNSADNGGGMYNYQSNPEVTNCTFYDNTAIYGGGMYNELSNPHVNNCTFSANNATSDGGGMYNNNSNPVVVNCIFWDSSGGEIVNDAGAPELRFCIVRNGETGTGTISSNIITQDPLLEPLADNGGKTQTCAIPPGSPAVDAGTEAGAPDDDQRGVSRPQGSGVDIGAYELKVDTGSSGCQMFAAPGLLLLPLVLILLKRN